MINLKLRTKTNYFTKKSIALFLIPSLITLILYFFTPSFLNRVVYSYGDFRFKLRGITKPNPNIVIVAIDEKSIDKIGRWVWSRKIFSDVIKSISSYQPKVIAIDIVFSEPESNPIDIAFGNTLKEANNVILGYFFRTSQNNTSTPESIKQLNRSNIKIIKYIGNRTVHSNDVFDSVELNMDEIGKAAKGVGFFNMIPDIDGNFRSAQLLIGYKGNVYPSLSLESVNKYLNTQLVLEQSKIGYEGLFLNNNFVPTNRSGQIKINYYGPSNTFSTYSAVDVYEKRVSKDSLKDKIVFVGTTELGIYDVRSMPLDPVFSGVEIQATVASNILDSKYLVDNIDTKVLDIFLIILYSLLLIIVLSQFDKTLYGIMFFLVLLITHLTTNYLFFSKLSIMLSGVFPTISIGLSYLVFETYRNLVVEKKSRYLKKAFSSYVSPDLVSQIIDDPDKLKLGGEKKEITILFSDIRGFTSLSERTDPELLVSLLNEYLTPMTRIIVLNQGTLDKYIGDAIMAIFGAPVDVDRHSYNACISAVEMLEELIGINKKWSSKKLPNISIGVGINTGEAVVGNMGADIRFDYTAIGDSVNLASRLEGLNKFYGTNILISESTLLQFAEADYVNFNNSDEPFLVRKIDYVQVKGKKEPIKIYELINKSNELLLNSEALLLFDEVLGHYRNREFNKAQNILLSILDKFPDDVPSKIYVERCKEYIKNPPDSDWNSVYEAKEK